MPRSAVAVSCLVLGLLLVGCDASGTAVSEISSQSSASVRASTPETVRQTDDQGRRLPFTTRFPNRWNENNDGSKYEPCTSVRESALESVNLEPATVEDVAGADKQTARGCRWYFSGERFAQAAQFVGNITEPNRGLEGYKSQNDGWRWFPDQVVGGRTIAVSSLGDDHCATHVLSGLAIVHTSVSLRSNSRDVVEKCRRALAFTRATIDLIPR